MDFLPQSSFDTCGTPQFVVVPLLKPSSNSTISNLRSLLQGYTRSRFDTDVSTSSLSSDPTDSINDDNDEDLAINLTDKAVVLVPYNQISPPGNWKADKTPLKNFAFSSNCTRLAFRFSLPELPTQYLPLFPNLNISGLIGVIDALDHQGSMEDAVEEFNMILAGVNRANG